MLGILIHRFRLEVTQNLDGLRVGPWPHGDRQDRGRWLSHAVPLGRLRGTHRLELFVAAHGLPY
jgi:hypothetical protein